MPVACPECESEDLALVADLDDGRKEVSCDACGHSWVRGEAKPARPPTGSEQAKRGPQPDVLIVAARVAYPEYHSYNAYVTHPGRSYRETDWLAFLAKGAIQAEIPKIRYRRDHVPWTMDEAARLEAAGDDVSQELASLIRRTLEETERHEEGTYQVFLLTTPQSEETFKLPAPIKSTKLDHKGAPVALTFGHRYTTMDQLEKQPQTTDELGL